MHGSSSTVRKTSVSLSSWNYEQFCSAAFTWKVVLLGRRLSLAANAVASLKEAFGRFLAFDGTFGQPAGLLWQTKMIDLRDRTSKPLEASDSVYLDAPNFWLSGLEIHLTSEFRLKLGVAAVAFGTRPTFREDLAAFVVYYGTEEKGRTQPGVDILLYYYFSYMLSSKRAQASAVSHSLKNLTDWRSILARQ